MSPLVESISICLAELLTVTRMIMLSMLPSMASAKKCRLEWSISPNSDVKANAIKAPRDRLRKMELRAAMLPNAPIVVIARSVRVER